VLALRLGLDQLGQPGVLGGEMGDRWRMHGHAPSLVTPDTQARGAAVVSLPGGRFHLNAPVAVTQES
jgi:hypothetical protein